VLTLEVELLTGAYRASLPDGSGAEWPPHPERVFSTLAQAWGDGGCDSDERAALEWLEGLEPPEIEASASVNERSAPTVFVPPNDARGTNIEAMPDRRRRQARTFRVAVPDHPVIRFHWVASPSEPVLRALSTLAHRVASLGHSASLVRASFPQTQEAPDVSRLWLPAIGGRTSLRTAYSGRLKDLEQWFAEGRAEGERPRSRKTVPYRAPAAAPAAHPAAETVFAGPSGWFVFEDAGGSRPDLIAFAHVARRLRDALMNVGPQPPAEVVSGHGPDDGPSSRPHIAIVPLASVGWEHSGGELLGFAIVLPRTVSPDDRRAVLESVAKLVRFEEDRVAATLQLTRQLSWHVERSAMPSRASLRPERWCATARIWSSATPVILDRFPEEDDPLEIARLIAASCRHIGLPEPAEIEIHKHSALTGAPSAYAGRGRGPGWTFPSGSKLADRPRRHVVLRFEAPVSGPILLGAGRYHGFGLLLPTEAHDEHSAAHA